MAEKRGTVKWFSARKGYGFIEDEDGIDHFAHFSEIQSDGFRKLRAGQQVTFEAGEDDNGRSLAKCIQPEPMTDAPSEDLSGESPEEKGAAEDTIE